MVPSSSKLKVKALEALVVKPNKTATQVDLDRRPIFKPDSSNQTLKTHSPKLKILEVIQ